MTQRKRTRRENFYVCEVKWISFASLVNLHICRDPSRTFLPLRDDSPWCVRMRRNDWKIFKRNWVSESGDESAEDEEATSPQKFPLTSRKTLLADAFETKSEKSEIILLQLTSRQSPNWWDGKAHGEGPRITMMRLISTAIPFSTRKLNLYVRGRGRLIMPVMTV